MDDLGKKNRELRRALVGLVGVVEQFLTALDSEMQKPSSYRRGRRVARLMNALEMAKDHVRFGVLDIDFRTGRRRAGKKRPSRAYSGRPEK